MLAHKPAQLEEVAAEVAPHAKAVVSILGGMPLADVEAAYPGAPVVPRACRTRRSRSAQGVIVLAADGDGRAPTEASRACSSASATCRRCPSG